jgi:hypothetical protein
MRKSLSFIAAGLVAAALPAQAAAPVDREAELARAIGDRVAGEPVDCVDLHRVQSSRIIPGTAIIYEAGGVFYVNRPRAGAESLDRWDTLLTRLTSTRLCSIDTVELIDQGTGMMTGVVFLGDFVPYRRIRTSSID